MPEVKSRREMYSEATRAALLDTATALFAERGYAGTSLEDVASASQVTRGAVYHHFASKQALFEAVLELQEARVTAEVLAAASAPDPWDAALLALDAYLTHCCDPVYGRLVWLEARPRSAGTAGGSARRTTPTGWSSGSSGTWSRPATSRTGRSTAWSSSRSGCSAAPGSPWPRRRRWTGRGCGTNGGTSSARRSVRCESNKVPGTAHASNHTGPQLI